LKTKLKDKHIIWTTVRKLRVSKKYKLIIKSMSFTERDGRKYKMPIRTYFAAKCMHTTLNDFMTTIMMVFSIIRILPSMTLIQIQRILYLILKIFTKLRNGIKV
jgi:hypothetical protein